MMENLKKTFSLFRSRLKLLINQRMMQIIVLLSPILILVTIILLVVLYDRLPPQVPLFYSRPWGNDQLTYPLSLFLLPLGSLFWYLLTLLLISTHIYQYRVFSQLLFIFSLVITFFSTLAVINILILVL